MRKIFSLLAIALLIGILSVGAQAQILLPIRSPIPTAPAPPGPPLDSLTNAVAAAYGVTKLRTAYAGNCMTVTLISNSTTQAIGFDGATPPNCNDAAAVSFCTSDDLCAVTTWNDQSGNGVNITSAASFAPRLRFNKINGHMVLSSLGSKNAVGTISSTSAVTTIMVFQSGSAAGTFLEQLGVEPGGGVISGSYITEDGAPGGGHGWIACSTGVASPGTTQSTAQSPSGAVVTATNYEGMCAVTNSLQRVILSGTATVNNTANTIPAETGVTLASNQANGAIFDGYIAELIYSRDSGACTVTAGQDCSIIRTYDIAKFAVP